MCPSEQVPVYICAYVQRKVCTIAWLQGVSQYFNLFQDTLTKLQASVLCVYKKSNPIYLKWVWGKSCTSERSSKTRLEHKNVAMVVPSRTRGPSVTVPDGSQNQRPEKEIKTRTSVFGTSLYTLLATSDLWLRDKICFRHFSEIALLLPEPTYSEGCGTRFWQLNPTDWVVSLCFICFERTDC